MATVNLGNLAKKIFLNIRACAEICCVIIMAAENQPPPSVHISVQHQALRSALANVIQNGRRASATVSSVVPAAVS